MIFLKSLVYFVLAGVCEIAGGYLIWQWLRAEKSAWLGVAGRRRILEQFATAAQVPPGSLVNLIDRV